MWPLAVLAGGRINEGYFLQENVCSFCGPLAEMTR